MLSARRTIFLGAFAAGIASAIRPRAARFSHPVPHHSAGAWFEAPSCSELFHEQPLDHFAPSPGTFPQRYFLYDGNYRRDAGGPMFFYLGNEMDVTLYVNATGLIWENARSFGALVVFAEHRYYGASQPFPDDPTSDLRYLTTGQALMDYVGLVGHLKKEYGFAPSDAVVGFGGSYGGMLATWGRLRFPHVWDGAVAASAPVVAFEGVMAATDDMDFYAVGETFDVMPAAGAGPHCETNLRKAFAAGGLTRVDPAVLRSAFHLCDTEDAEDAALATSIATWINEALSYMAMGNFPYRSTYILNGDGSLPPFPVRVACESLAEDLTHDDRTEEWLHGLASFAAVYYNYTGSIMCNTLSAPVNEESRIVNELWDYQYCSQIFMVLGTQTTPTDMFGNAPWDGDAVARDCAARHGFLPHRRHFADAYGTPADWARSASNIVWSQGEYDPWRGGGVISSLSDTLVAVVIPGAAHHLDLFFSNENDTDEVIAVRALEMEHVRKWVEEKRTGYAHAPDPGAVMLGNNAGFDPDRTETE